ncbi:MAG: hypothetical protein JNM92_11795 [Zoogloea sp.]|nr:hypothetical protein [Zoogloea sp.]
MPYQNRVTPRGDIIFSASKAGTLMGNRGCLHNAEKQLIRTSKTTNWVTCLLKFKGFPRRELMADGSYTELFFLDEATALAAGHRPCYTCQNKRYGEFKVKWFVGQGLPAGDVQIMDKQLHAERRAPDGTKLTYVAALDDLPDGTFVAGDGASYLLFGARLLRWSAEGYLDARSAPAGLMVEVLTPRSVVEVLRHDYMPALHPSAQALLGQ